MYEHDYNKNPELSDAQLEMLQFSSPHQQITEDFNAIVVKVHDGDTITLQTTFRDFNFPLRFLDIDAPEMSEGGDIAKEWLTNRLLGEHIKVEINKKNRVGKYGRLLGKVIHRGMNTGQEMMHLGLVSKFGAKKEGEPDDINKTFSMKQWF